MVYLYRDESRHTKPVYKILTRNAWEIIGLFVVLLMFVLACIFMDPIADCLGRIIKWL